jgi:hypothetical protein
MRPQPAQIALVLSSALLLAGLAFISCATDTGSAGAQAQQSCDSCLSGTCAEKTSACLGDATCRETFECAQKCDDGEKWCIWNCVLARPQSVPAFFPAAHCTTKQCSPACKFPGRVVDACLECNATQCGQAMTGCFENRECWALVHCVRNNCQPGDLECAQECIAEHPDGLVSIQPLRDCGGEHCAKQCAGREMYTTDGGSPPQ